MDPGPAAGASPGKLLEKKIVSPTPELLNQKLGVCVLLTVKKLTPLKEMT